MKRRTVIPLGIMSVLLFGLLLVVIRSALTPQPPITRARFDGIRVGSTRGEIERLLGKPGNRVPNMVIVWVPQDDSLVSANISGAPNVVFFPDAEAEPGCELVWLDESGLIAVHFGKDDRLQNKYFSTVFNPGRPTFFRWVATRF